MLSEIQQFKSLIEKANNILVCFKSEFNFDDVCSVSVLVDVLKEQNKKFSVVCENFSLAKELDFLENMDLVEDKLKNLQQFVISLDLKDKKINEFSYDVKDKNLEIYILPEEGEIDEKEIKFKKNDFRFDLIITLGTPDLESLGNVFLKNSDFFFAVTIINIDIELKNENYGQLNLVKPNNCSVTEILFELIKEIDKDLIDEKMATAILAGMIDKTKSFKQININSKNLNNASDLIELGANKEKIINNFYRNKKVSTLRLWGRVLARLNVDKDSNFVWASLPYNDFIRTGSVENDIKGVVDELILNSPQADVILLMYEKKNNEIGVDLYSDNNYDSKYLLNNYEIKGDKKFVTMNLKDKKLKEVENELVSVISEKLKFKN